LYHVCVHPLAQKVIKHIRDQELLAAGNRVGVAVSGGSDSVALLRLLLEMREEVGVVLSVVHVNHNLRGDESDADERFVVDLAAQFDLPIFRHQVEVAAHAGTEQISIETAARELRYQFFAELLEREPCSLDLVATGHTLDDQAETVLMRILRGTGMRGLGGIHPHLELEDQPGEIVRPLLSVRRAEIEKYLRDLHQPWREDSSNREHKFTRNRVRHVLIPLLEREFNPRIAENLSELAAIARAEEDYWESEAAGWMGTAVQWFSRAEVDAASANGLVQVTSLPASSPIAGEANLDKPQNAAVNRHWLLAEPLALQRRVIKSIGDEVGLALEFKHVEEILSFAAQEGASNKELVLPLGWKILCEEELLIFEGPDPSNDTAVDYAYCLPVPGQVSIPELHSTIQIVNVTSAVETAGYNPDQLFDASLLSKELTVRNWRQGDHFWPAHTKSPKKVKELLQERHITGRVRKLWPVIVSGDEIVWIRGFAVPAKYLPATGTERPVTIRELMPE
jgi:tRNA(Ile)-lysidine synthase